MCKKFFFLIGICFMTNAVCAEGLHGIPEISELSGMPSETIEKVIKRAEMIAAPLSEKYFTPTMVKQLTDEELHALMLVHLLTTRSSSEPFYQKTSFVIGAGIAICVASCLTGIMCARYKHKQEIV